MGNVRDLHNEAMALAQEAVTARAKGDAERAAHLAARALIPERIAAEMLPATPKSEPTRSTLFLSAAFSPNGKLVAAGGRGHVLVWDVASGHRVAALSGDFDDVTALAFSHDGAFLAAGGKRFLRCWRHGPLKVGESCDCDVHAGSLGGLAKAP